MDEKGMPDSQIVVHEVNLYNLHPIFNVCGYPKSNHCYQISEIRRSKDLDLTKFLK